VDCFFHLIAMLLPICEMYASFIFICGFA
jgi:hypothetical protein